VTFEVCAAVVTVTDGDTFVADLAIWHRWTMRAHVRLLGIDAAEMRGGTEESRAEAKAARAWLEERIGGRAVIVRAVGEDSFGRVLAEVYADGENLSEQMLELGLAKPYQRRSAG
jgi:micrococcal nuclease